MGDTVTYYQRRRRVVGTVIYGLLLVWVILRLAYFIDWDDAVDVVPTVALTALAAFGLVATWRVSITVTREGLTVRNTFSNHRLRWDEIHQAEYRFFPSWYKTGGVFLLLKNGRELRCAAYSDSSWDDMPATQHLLAVLNARVRPSS